MIPTLNRRPLATPCLSWGPLPSILGALLVLACGGEAAEPDAGHDGSAPSDARVDPADVLDGVCLESAPGTSGDGDPVARCTRLFPDHPYVHLPADDLASPEATLYVAIDLEHELRLRDRRGERFQVLGEDGVALSLGGSPEDLDFVTGSPGVAVTEGLRLPSNRHVFTVYEVRGTLQAADEGRALQLRAARPVVIVEPEAIEGDLGTWEGEVSARLASGGWDWGARVRLRIRFHSVEPLDPFATWGRGSSPLADGERLMGIGEIENWSAGVRAADGACLPPLEAMGAANPFYGATAPTVELYRVLGMHVYVTEQNLVLTYPPGTQTLPPDGMAALEPLHPMGLIREEPVRPADDITLIPHGNPMGHQLDLHRVEGGGDGC